MKNKVLLVDNEPELLRTCSAILKAEGYEVSEASTGDMALTMMEGHRPDVILFNTRLPGNSGIDFARQYSMRSYAHDIPLVMATALDEFELGNSFDSFPKVRRLSYKACWPRTMLEEVGNALRSAH